MPRQCREVRVRGSNPFDAVRPATKFTFGGADGARIGIGMLKADFELSITVQ